MNEKGFTILEVLVAILIIAFGLLALMRALSGGLMGSKRSHDVTVATLLAQQKLEEVRASNITAWSLSDGYGGFAVPYENFEWQMAVNDPGTANLKEVSLSIYWPAELGDESNRSKQRCVNFKTYMAKYN